MSEANGKFKEGQRVQMVDPYTTMFDWGENDKQYRNPSQFVGQEATVLVIGWTEDYCYYYEVKFDAVPYEKFWFQQHQLRAM